MNTTSPRVANYKYADIFVPNQNRTIFNHDISSCSNEQVPGNDLYSGRALGLTEPSDIIQLHASLKQQWPYITKHYQSIELAFTQSVIWNTSYQLLSNYPQYQPSFFYYGDEACDNNSKYYFYHIVNFIHSKNNFMSVAKDLDLPVPKTFCYYDKTFISDTAIFPYPCFLKAAVSVLSGAGIYRCENETELFNALNQFDNNAPIQIQEEVLARSFVNVQYKATSIGVERFAATDQLLNGYSHIGNRYPTKFSCWHVTDPLAQYLYNKGMEGIFAFDVAVIDEDNSINYRLIECNPYYNTVSYPTWIAKKLAIESWTAENFSTRIRSLRQLDLSGIEFNQQQGSGIILVNWGTILAGNISVLLVGSDTQQQALRQQLLKRI